MFRCTPLVVLMALCGLIASFGCTRSQPAPPNPSPPKAPQAALDGQGGESPQEPGEQDAGDSSRKPQDDAECLAKLQERNASVERDEEGFVVQVTLPEDGLPEDAFADLLPRLEGLPRLRRLSLAGSQVAGNDLEVVSRLSGLEELDLFDTQIGDSGLDHLAALPKLRRLSLAGTQISDEGLAAIGALRELRELDLGWTRLTGKTLDKLSSLRSLERLNLTWTLVTDEQVEVLQSLKHLRQLTLTDTDMTDAGFEQLREALPNAEIVSRDAVADAIRQGSTQDYRLAGAGVGDIYRIVAGDYQTAWNDFLRRYSTATSEQQREETAMSPPDPRPFADRMLKLADDNPEHAAAIDALLWVVGADERYVQDLQQLAIERLLERYVDDPRLGDACLQAAQASDAATQSLFKQVCETTSDDEVRGKASFALARSLAILADEAQQMTQMDEIARNQAIQLQGIPAVSRLLDARPAVLLEESERLFEEVGQQHAMVPYADTTLGELAKARLFEMRSLGVGKEAPEIKGQDVDGQPLTLHEHRGKVVVLTFWGNWCGPCRAMFPHERELAARLKDEPFAMLGVNSDRDRELARQVMLQENLTWRSWWDGGSTVGPISSSWRVERWPTIYVLDQHGVIRFKDVRGEALDRAVDTLLTEMKAGDPAADKPAEEPKPPADKPEAPADKPEAPAAKPETPAAKPETPAAKPEAPADKPEAPADKPDTPAAKPETPADKPEAPAGEPEKPAEA